MLSSPLPKIKRNILRNRPKTFHLIMAMPWFFSRPRYPVTSTSVLYFNCIKLECVLTCRVPADTETLLQAGRTSKNTGCKWQKSQPAQLRPGYFLRAEWKLRNCSFHIPFHTFRHFSSLLRTVHPSTFTSLLGCHAQKSFRVFFLRFSSLLFRIFRFVRFTLQTVSISRGKVASK